MHHSEEEAAYCSDLQRLEQWAKEKGCAEIRMGHLSDLNPEKVRRFYQRMGYRQVETNYAKRLVA